MILPVVGGQFITGMVVFDAATGPRPFDKPAQAMIALHVGHCVNSATTSSAYDVALCAEQM